MSARPHELERSVRACVRALQPAFALLLLATLCAAQTRKGEEAYLFPVRQNDLWGYIDRTGKLVIRPQFEIAWDFTEGLAYVKAGARRGVIDRKGKWVFELTDLDFAGSYADGLAPVQTVARPLRYGFVDRVGRVVIKPQFDAVRPFAEGLAVALVGRQYGFIDKRGQWVIQPRFDKVSSFSEGLALVVVNNRHGFINRTGSLVIQPQYNNAYNFSEGLANIALGGRYGCIDKTGALVIPLQAGYVGLFSEGLAPLIA